MWPCLSTSPSLLFFGKYATKGLSEKQSVFLLPCQTLQGKHYRLNCLIPICIIRRSDNCRNRDAKGRLRATYACCQPFAAGKAKPGTSAGMSSIAHSVSQLPGSLSHPCGPQRPTPTALSLPSGGVSDRASLQVVMQGAGKQTGSICHMSWAHSHPLPCTETNRGESMAKGKPGKSI